MKSLWSQTTEISNREPLKEDIHVENVVIGGGMAGLLIAYMLQEKGRKVIVLEEKEIASGQTKNTTAKITSQHGLIYADMIKNIGLEKAIAYARANEDAIRMYKEIITKEGIACHFEELPSFLYSRKTKGMELLKAEAEAAKRLGIQAKYVQGNEITELPFGVAGGVCFEGQAQFHPLEFLKEIAEKLTIYERTKVLEVDEHFIITEHGVVVAEHVIFATHYPFPIVPGYYFLRQHQERSYALALEGQQVPSRLSAMYYGIDRGGLSFRCADGKLILGGGSHRTGKKHITWTDKSEKKPEGFCYLKEKAKQLYPEGVEITRWAAQDCMPHDGIPFIGRFSVKRENWFVATGFQKWGMTSSMIAAMMISDWLTYKKSPYEAVFSPQRCLIKAGWKNLLVDMGESTLGLIKGIFVRDMHRCTHMGCGLSWNEEEQTWDCACHGSRYSKDGEIIDNPAQMNTKENIR